MLRDIRRDKKYFDGAVADIDDSILRYKLRLQQPEKLQPYGRMGGFAGLCRLTLERLECCYSRGDKLIDLKSDISNLLGFRGMQREYADALPAEDINRKVDVERLSFTLYRRYFIWLAFAVNLNFDRDYFKKILALMDNPGVDSLFDRVAIKLGEVNRALAKKALYEKPYTLLLNVIDAEPAHQGQLMNIFLDAWYPACVKQDFFDTHNITENFAYRGYWCFEAALIVKLFSIDDSSFRNHQYYPAALVYDAADLRLA